MKTRMLIGLTGTACLAVWLMPQAAEAGERYYRSSRCYSTPRHAQHNYFYYPPRSQCSTSFSYGWRGDYRPCYSPRDSYTYGAGGIRIGGSGFGVYFSSSDRGRSRYDDRYYDDCRRRTHRHRESYRRTSHRRSYRDCDRSRDRYDRRHYRSHDRRRDHDRSRDRHHRRHDRDRRRHRR
jgi:hypothetical protein